MAFDSGMLAASLSELRRVALGARIEKVYQPERDEITLQMRTFDGEKSLLINAGSNNPRICFSQTRKENPQNPPMLCMLLRKHLQGARLTEISQVSFDRIAVLGFEGRDELGFECKKYLIAELMGKYSNLFFTDEDKRIVTALKTADLSLDSKRGLLSGMIYAPPAPQDKKNPINVSESELCELLLAAPGDKPCDKLLTSGFMGFSPLISREIVFRATGSTDTPAALCKTKALIDAFFDVIDTISSESFAPCIIKNGEEFVEYSFLPITQYEGLQTVAYESAGAMLDAFFAERDNRQRVHQRASDILKLLTNAESRLKRKLELQRDELALCDEGESMRKYGDLLTANLYKLPERARFVELEDYEQMGEDGTCPKIKIELDTRLSPAANAQRYYKKYAKSKRAKHELAHQIELGESELEYIYSVFDALTKAEMPNDLLEIREELYRSGYASRMKSFSAKAKQKAPTLMQFVTPDGMRVLCGKNNLQNEHLTHKVAEKNDYWFHVRGCAGSHVVLVTEGREPTDLDFTTAAEIAAFYSSADGDNIGVDYTLAKNVKKPSGAKPGFVIYHTNWTAYVTPNGDRIAALRSDKQAQKGSHNER